MARNQSTRFSPWTGQTLKNIRLKSWKIREYLDGRQQYASSIRIYNKWAKQANVLIICSDFQHFSFQNFIFKKLYFPFKKQNLEQNSKIKDNYWYSESNIKEIKRKMYTHNDANSLRYAEMKSQMNNKSLMSNISQQQTVSSLSAGKSTNLKSKFTLFEDSLNDLETQTQVLVMDTQKTIRKCQNFKTSLSQDLVQEYNLKCKQQISQVDKLFSEKRKETQKNTQQLWKGCEAMMQQSEQLKNVVKDLQNRIQKIEITLGYYNAEDKLGTF